MCNRISGKNNMNNAGEKAHHVHIKHFSIRFQFDSKIIKIKQKYISICEKKNEIATHIEIATPCDRERLRDAPPSTAPQSPFP